MGCSFSAFLSHYITIFKKVISTAKDGISTNVLLARKGSTSNDDTLLDSAPINPSLVRIGNSLRYSSSKRGLIKQIRTHVGLIQYFFSNGNVQFVSESLY